MKKSLELHELFLFYLNSLQTFSLSESIQTYILLPFISVPGTLGQAWYLREILVERMQLSRLEAGELQEPRPKS